MNLLINSAFSAPRFEDSRRMYRITLKSGARGIVEETSPIKAWKSVVGDIKLIARVEVLRESIWVELKGVV